MGLLDLFKKKEVTTQESAENNVWTLEGLEDEFVIVDNSIFEQINPSMLQREIQVINPTWTEIEHEQLVLNGYDVAVNIDESINFITLPVGHYALVKQTGEFTEMYVYSDELKAHITSNEVYFFIKASEYNIHTDDNELVIGVDEDVFKEFDELSDYVDQLYVGNDGKTGLVEGSFNINLETGRNSITVKSKFGEIEISQGGINYPDVLTYNVNNVQDLARRQSIKVSSTSKLERGDNIIIVGLQGSIFMHSKIKSVNKRNNEVRLEDFNERLHPGMTLLLNEPDTVFIPVEIKSVDEIVPKGNIGGTNHITVKRIHDNKTIAASFIRSPKEGETIEEIAEEFVEKRFPSHKTKPYLYW